MNHLNESLTRINQGRIPPEVTNVPEDNPLPYLLSFLNYHKDEKKHCELNKFKASQIIGKLKILQECPKHEIMKWLSPIHNLGSYSFLFKGLSDDIELYEMTCGSAGRIFLFLVGNVIYLRLVKHTHINI